MLYHEIFATHPADKVALIFREKTVTYGELRAKVNRWAAFLQSQGVRKGDKVALFSKNSHNYIAAYFAIIAAGGVVVPLNFQLAPLEIAFIIKDAGIKVFITRDLIEMDEALVAKGVDWKVKQFNYEMLAEVPQLELAAVPMDENDNCTIIYTSGTTGTPKGAMLSHKNLLSNTIGKNHEVCARPSDVCMCVLPMYHAFGWITSVSGNLMVGATIVIQENYVFKDTMNLIKKYQVNGFCGVPTMMLMFFKGATAEDLKSIRYLISGGAACPKALSDGFLKKFGRPIREGYGLSEASPVCCVNPAEKIKAGSIGKDMIGVTTQIQDENGNELPPEHVGEICVRGDNVMLGYLNRPEETAHALRGGWLHTGDLAYKDKEGYGFIVDRIKDLIISSGENIYPREIEEVLFAHPEVEEAAVIGLPDRLRGQIVCAYIVPKEGAQLDKKVMRKYLLARIAPYKVPREYVFCAELPKNTTGKVLKRVLREQAVTEMVSKKHK